MPPIEKGSSRFELGKHGYAAHWTRPIPVSERLPVGTEWMFYFPGITRLYGDDGTAWPVTDLDHLKSDIGQWEKLIVCEDGWLKCYGTRLKLSDATHYLPLPPKPE